MQQLNKLISSSVKEDVLLAVQLLITFDNKQLLEFFENLKEPLNDGDRFYIRYITNILNHKIETSFQTKNGLWLTLWWDDISLSKKPPFHTYLKSVYYENK